MEISDEKFVLSHIRPHLEQFDYRLTNRSDARYLPTYSVRYRQLNADRTMWLRLVIVRAPSPEFSDCIVEATIPGRSNRRVKIEHSATLYKQRNRIERISSNTYRFVGSRNNPAPNIMSRPRGPRSSAVSAMIERA